MGKTKTITEQSGAGLSVVEAAKYCGISRTLLYRLIKDGDGPIPVNLGRRVLYMRADLDNWLRSNRVTSEEQ